MMFSLFPSVKSSKGQLCTDELFLRTINSKEVINLCVKIAKEEDHDKQNILKKDLPVVTWMAFFGDNARKIENATPSGLVMVDIDGVENPEAVWNQIKERDPQQLGILIAHKTPSTHGLRIVFRNQEGLDSVVANLEWFANQFPSINIDKVCKDLSRSSFLVPGSYFYYTDMSIFKDMWPVYIKEGGAPSSNDSVESENEAHSLGTQDDLGTYEKYGVKWFVVNRLTDLFGNVGEPFTDADLKYGDTDIREIALKWLNLNGGIPQKGSRNSTLFALACNLRYLCEFSADMLLACMPALLPRREVISIVEGAIKRDRIVGIPKSMREAIAFLKESKAEADTDWVDNVFNHLQSPTDIMPTEALPPIFRQFVGCAPTDFRKATIVALLPMLGTLGSRLRARYLDGKMHSPSFQCEIEAPMASGKSFTRDIFDNVMKDVLEQDAVWREKEAIYEDKLRKAKNAKEQPEKESYPIRLLGSKVSIAALLDRIAYAKGLHVMSFDEEVRNVIDSMKAGGFGDIRALLRNAFDNSIFGQEYKSENSSKRLVAIMYNTLHCGTPAEYRKLYNNAEDGTITRVVFCELPDQSYKKMPVFKKLTYWQQKDIDKAIKRLSEISMKGDKVQPEYELTNFNFVNEWADAWLEKMRKLAMKFEDLSLDTFRKRAAVVGFRSAMLAWFLYDKDTEINRKKTIEFAEMNAEHMLVTLMQRYSVVEMSNTILYKQVWNRLGKVFTNDEAKKIVEDLNVKSPWRMILFRWKQKNLIENIEENKYRKKVK